MVVSFRAFRIRESLAIVIIGLVFGNRVTEKPYQRSLSQFSSTWDESTSVHPGEQVPGEFRGSFGLSVGDSVEDV
jgi:hypothetical protein